MAKPGKYAEIVKTLPREWGTEPDFQVKINGIKAAIIAEIPDSTETERPLSDDALEDMLMDVAATLKVLNDKMITALGPSPSASRLAACYRQVRTIKNYMEAQEKTTNVLLEAYKQLIVDRFEAEDTRSVSFLDGASVSIQEEPHGKVIDRDANRLWAIENGLENSLALPWQTVNALTKEALTKGEEAPAGVEITSRPKIVLRK